VSGARVTKLYLPPGAMRFASRQAHELIYPPRLGSKPQTCHALDLA
jgi:hypothetical protein